MPEPVYKEPEMSGLAGELAKLNSYALSRVQRKYNNVTRMLNNKIRQKVPSLAMEEHKEWDSVKTLEDWERFRDKRLKVLKASLGEFPDKRPPLLYQVSGTYKGNGYQVKNIVYQSRPGFFVAANLYLPENPVDNMPGIIIIPSFHYPKTQGEIKDCGMIWARTGCAVLIVETLGHGERIETIPWYRQANYSDYLIEMQLNLIGQSRLGWIAWDIMRTVDLFYEMGNIDREKIILIGSVTSGGGMPAGITGVFEKRLSAVIPFNFGRVYWRGLNLRGIISNKIPDWFICAATAPRKLIYAHEFSWEGEEGPGYSSVWVSAWQRYKKLYSLYGVEDNLATVQGTGLLRVQATAGDCYSLGPAQRNPIFPVLKKWFNIPMPSVEDQNIPIDSELSFAKIRPDYPVIKYKESKRRMPDSDILSITPAISEKLNRKAMHQIASEMSENLLKKARSKRALLDDFSARKDLIEDLSNILGDIEPNKNPEIELLWSKKLSGASVEAMTLKPEPNIIIPMFMLKPDVRGNNTMPLVIALSEGGKDRFLKNRSKDIEKLLQNGIAVCIPDVRGTGETAPGQYNRSNGLTNAEFELGKTLIGLRVKDVRTVLAYIKRLGDINPEQIALWGDSFAPVNSEDLWVDELIQWQVSPQIQYYASPLGAHLALLTALYNNEVSAVAVRGGLVGYSSLLNDNFTYVPSDITIPGILKVGDISDICVTLVPKPLLIERCVDGRNYNVENEKLQEEMAIVKEAYRSAGSLSNLTIREDDAKPELISWLIKQLKK